MVMLTRSAHKKACESSSNSDISRKNINPPWCSSGKVYVKRKTKIVAAPLEWEMHSTYPLRENIWEYLYEDNVEQKYNNNCNNKRKRRYKKTSADKHSGKRTTYLLVLLFFLGIGAIVSFWSDGLKHDLTKLISISFSDKSTAISEECCQKLKYMTDELAKAGYILRNILRSRSAMMLSTRTKTVLAPTDTRYVTGAIATRGVDTKEWGGSITLWGLIPLWRVAPPPSVIFSLRPPTTSDCWPFIGSYGEILIHLPKIQRISHISIEHVHPDIARSAPNHFVLYGTLWNNTSIKVLTAQYRADGPVKQYYRTAHRELHWKGLILRVLSNQGNKKYTCIYRFHLYVENDPVISR